jgi:hypothetical protein
MLPQAKSAALRCQTTQLRNYISRVIDLSLMKVRICRALWYSQAPSEMEEPMRELQREEIGNRRVRLVANQENRYSVMIEVCGPHGSWQDISLAADRDLSLHTASLCYRLRLTEQQPREIEWGSD